MARGKLLLIDDEPLLLDLLKEEFEELDIECVTAGNGIEALTSLQAESPDAIVCDIAMPGLDGLEFLIEMHKIANYTPLIFLTGHGDKEHAYRALRNGAFDFFEKPFDRIRLREAVDKAMRLGQELRTLEQELDELCSKQDLPAAEMEKYRSTKRFFLRNRKHMDILLKKGD